MSCLFSFIISVILLSKDAIFRLALFMDRLDKGVSVMQAAQDARKSFIDYNIKAPAINWMRQYPTPFLAYTYRVIPILAETAASIGITL